MCGVDVAGPTEVVRKELGEGHLDRALRGPAITFGMIGRSFDGIGRVGGVLHAEGIEQFLLKDSIPIRSACGFGHDATSQEMGDVRIGEGRTETGYRLDVAQGADQRRLVKAEHPKSCRSRRVEAPSAGRAGRRRGTRA